MTELTYGLPVEELLPLAALCRYGEEWLRRNDKAAPPPRLLARIADLERAAAAAGRGVDVVADVDAPVAHPLTSVKVEPVGSFQDEVSLPRAAALRGCSRQALWARIDRGTLPARKDEAGRWLVPLSAVAGED